MNLTTTAAELARVVGGELTGPHNPIIHTMASLGAAQPGSLSFLASSKYRTALQTSRASCFLVHASSVDDVPQGAAAIVVPDAYAAYAALSRWWKQQVAPPLAAGVHVTAWVDPSVTLPCTVSVGPMAVIEAGVVLGERAVVGAGSVVQRNASIGNESVIGPRCTVGYGCRIGARAVLHSGVVIGADGFGFARQNGRWEKIEQLGQVVIGDDVEIGANTCIDRGALEDTVIGNGVKLDNLIQIGHNVKVGDHTAMAGCVGVAGSTVIGQRCTVGGGAVVLGHLSIVDDVHISNSSVVSRSIAQPGQYTGFYPLEKNEDWEKNAVTLKKLYQLRQKIRQLER